MDSVHDVYAGIDLVQVQGTSTTLFSVITLLLMQVLLWTIRNAKLGWWKNIHHN